MIQEDEGKETLHTHINKALLIDERIIETIFLNLLVFTSTHTHSCLGNKDKEIMFTLTKYCYRNNGEESPTYIIALNWHDSMKYNLRNDDI